MPWRTRLLLLTLALAPSWVAGLYRMPTGQCVGLELWCGCSWDPVGGPLVCPGGCVWHGAPRP